MHITFKWDSTDPDDDIMEHSSSWQGDVVPRVGEHVSLTYGGDEPREHITYDGVVDAVEWAFDGTPSSPYPSVWLKDVTKRAWKE